MRPTGLIYDAETPRAHHVILGRLQHALAPRHSTDLLTEVQRQGLDLLLLAVETLPFF